VITKRWLQIGVAGWLLVVGIPTEQTIARSRLNNFAPFTMSSELAQVEGSSEGVAQKPDEPPELSPEESAERQRLRDLQAAVDAAIAKYFSSKPSEHKGGLDRWYYNGDYLRHVLGVSPMEIWSPDTTLQPRERFQGYEISVEVDKDHNIGEVERQLPSELDGVRVQVYPELSSEESAERQRLRDLQAPVDAAIAKYFSSKPSERKGGLDRWYYNGDYLRHVLGVSAMAIISPDTTLQPRERFRGDQIGVEVDMDENIGEVERQLPSKLDGVPVEVYPMPTGGDFLDKNASRPTIRDSPIRQIKSAHYPALRHCSGRNGRA
jgi:hypothetical protein